MAHIMSDEEYRVYQEFKATGLTPAKVRHLLAESLAEKEEYAPMPMIINPTVNNDFHFIVEEDWDE